MSIANEIQRLQSAKADIKSAIENKGVTVGDGTIDTYAQKISEISSGGSGDYEQGFEDGKNSVVDVARYCQRITFTNLNLFGTKEVVLNLDNAFTFYEMLRRSGVSSLGFTPNETVEHITINCPTKIVSMYYFCAGEPNFEENTLKHITLNVDTQKVEGWNYCFRYAKSIEIIDGMPLDFSSTKNITRPFDQCVSLKEIRFAPNTLALSLSIPNSPLLSDLSIQSIIDGLATVDTAQTITLHATVGAKLTDTQKATITAKNWTLVY